MKLQTINISDLQHIEAGQFIQRLFIDTKELNLDLGKDPNIVDYMEQLKDAFEQFNLALVQIAGQKETMEIFALDIVRDHCIITVERQIELYEYDTETAIKDAYANATRIMKKYKNIKSSNYEAESLEIQNLQSEWDKSENAECRKILNLDYRLSKLKIAADAFNVRFGNRSVAVTVKEVYNAKVLRKEMLVHYRELADYTLAMAKPKKAAPLYGALLDSLNHIRQYFADLLARREGGKKDDEGGK